MKFAVSGWSKQKTKQATKQAYTYMCNPVMLVWDSLRLTPIIVPKDTHKTKSCGSTVEYSNLAKEEKGKVSISSNTWQLYISHILTPPCHSAHFTNNHCSLTKLVHCLRKNERPPSAQNSSTAIVCIGKQVGKISDTPLKT